MALEALYLILCDDAQEDPTNFQQIDVFGLIASIRSTAAPPSPLSARASAHCFW
jgi:hypothetical protein